MDPSVIHRALQDITSGDQRLLQEIESVHRLIRMKHDTLSTLKDTLATSTNVPPSSNMEAEYRNDMETLAAKLSASRQEIAKKDAIIHELTENLAHAKVRKSGSYGSTLSCESGTQTEKEKDAGPRLQHAVAQVFDIVTGEPTDNVARMSNEQCVDALVSRVEPIVKKIERLMNFRQEVNDFLKRLNPSLSADDDVYSAWRKGRAKVLELQESNAALQSEIEDLQVRRMNQPERPHGFGREVLGAYQNIRNAFALCVRHSQWHKENARRGDDVEYHDVCELTRRVEEVQGRLHWVVTHCLDDSERNGALDAPVSRDDVLGAVRSNRVVTATPAIVCSAAPRVTRGPSPSSARPRSPLRNGTPTGRTPASHHQRAAVREFLAMDDGRGGYHPHHALGNNSSKMGIPTRRSMSPNNVSVMSGNRGRSTSTSPARVAVLSSSRWR
jgi:hypothetical protein